MRALLTLFSYILLTACAVGGDGPARGDEASKAPHSAGDHIKPPELGGPSFPVNTPNDPQARYCGVRSTSGQLQCASGEFCRRTVGDLCGAADAPGICTPVPELCTQEYAPVCGCDGRTYSNECAANSRGVSALSKGECPK